MVTPDDLETLQLNGEKSTVESVVQTQNFKSLGSSPSLLLKHVCPLCEINKKTRPEKKRQTTNSGEAFTKRFRNKCLKTDAC